MAHDELVDEYRKGRLSRSVAPRRSRTVGVSAAAALALSAAFAPAGHAVEATPGGPGNSDAAAERLCARVAELNANGDGYAALVWAASRKTGTGCPDDGSGALPGGAEPSEPPFRGVTAQHNEILVRA